MTALPAVIPDEGRVELGIVSANTPEQLVARATAAANSLAAVIKDRKLFSRIQGKDFVRCEGWTTLAAMMGVTPHEVSVAEFEGTFTATVELRRLTDGQSVGRASAECGMDEKTWAGRSRNARRSMALTRATAKACRLAFSWVMALSGFEVTPAEEIPQDEPHADRETGEVLDPASDAQIKLVFEEAARAGVTKEEFPTWYQTVTGRPWVKLYEQDVAGLTAAALKRRQERRAKAAPAATTGA